MIDWTEARKQAVRDRALEFLSARTPHRNRIAIPGVGADCICLVADLYRTAGIVGEFQLPQYRPDLGKLRERNLARDVFLECGFFEELDSEQPLEFGDTLVFRVGHQANHVGIVVDQACIHAIWARGVRRTIITDPFMRDVEAVLRPYRTGLRRDPATVDTLHERQFFRKTLNPTEPDASKGGQLSTIESSNE